MNPIIFFYNEFLWRPLFNALVWLYNVAPWHDLGVAIILLTILIRVALAPLMWKAQKSQKELALLQPEIKKIQEKHKNNREGQGKALMEFYATHKTNPFSGCLVMLLQLPILLALFSVFRQGFDPNLLTNLYPFVSHPGTLEPVAFGVLDLAKGNIILGAGAALTQFFQTKLMLPPPQPGQGDFAKAFQWQTLYVFPALLLVWSYSLPAALTLYWTVLNLFGIVQELVMRKVQKSP